MGFIGLVAWNVKIGLDLLNTNFNLLAVLSFSVVLLFLSALAKNIESRNKAMRVYEAHMRKNGKSHINSSDQSEFKL
jgi:hypothetical protein